MGPTTVLGIGNPLLGDDGLGIVALSSLCAEPLPPGVDAVDGGTYGLFLLPYVEDAENLLILDAVDVSAPPGSIVTLDGDQLPRLLRSTLSPHQVGLLDVLAAARLRGREPRRCAVIGVVPESVELRWGLSDPVAAALPELVARARALVEQWSGMRVPG